MKNLFYNKPTFTESTWALLALTRFCLAFIVMLAVGHLNNFAVLKMPLNYISMFGGSTAVMVFLMISGISVGYSLDKNKIGFLKRRFLRIYPLYFVAILSTVCLQYYLGSPYYVGNKEYVAAGDLTSIINFLLLQGIVAIDITFNNPVWSLSIESFLYLMLPLFFKMRLRYIYIILVISLCFYTFHSHLPFSVSLYGVKHIMFAWPFILGFLIAIKRQFWYSIPLILIGTFGVYYNYITDFVLDKYAFIWFFIAVLFVCFSMYFKMQLSKNTKVLFDLLGTISYPMYLFHIPLYLLLYHLGIRESYVFVCLVILLCIPINYIFDVWLKKIFWKPIVYNIAIKIKKFKIKRISNKILKV